MDIVRVLKRKDAASVVVAVVLGLLVFGAVQAWASRPADWLSGQDSAGSGWNEGFWRPLVTLVIELIVLEIVLRIYAALAGTQNKK
ncbi:MAG: hypothetical protein ABI220_02450 [Candidatus Saccharimonadales bacterium]